MVHPVVAPVLAWYDDVARDLPWRAPDRTPWGVLVSEVMLQQTPVVRVLPRWVAWMERWPTPADLAAAPTADVLRAWDTLGYPRRALRLVACARALVDQHGGELPDDEAALLALPGIGPYTAAAVVAFAHGRRAVVLDTNVRRVLGRLLAGTALPPPHLGVAERRAAEEVLPPDDATAARWSQAVMELGALVCTARSPACDECPVSARCAWLQAGRPADAHAGRRRTQAWTGTDRQARGRVLAHLRAAGHARADDLVEAWPADEQRARAVAGLVADGLVEVTDGWHHLPGEAPR
ncbi:A/G-specific adenine glycosylase [Cellulomonas sp. APG4]|uniref:A/G-specific adenine glycosylase n=1 Tax=Cellulomonas sp. APG4 TaxID=1538656 RepID=UPI00351AC4A4